MRRHASFAMTLGAVAMLCSMPLYTGCTSAVSDSSVASLPESSTPQDNQSETVSAAPSSGASPSGNYPQLETVSDPCAESCTKGGNLTVKHPDYGPITVVPYWRKWQGAEDHPTGNAAYGLYQNGRCVGYMEDGDRSLRWFAAKPVEEEKNSSWKLDNQSNVDKYGNVYLSYNGGVTVLTPTDQGYNSYDSMPSGAGAFKGAALHIDKAGEPDLTLVKGGKTVPLHWDGNHFAQKAG